ncbi:MAG: TetR/AcrR family transcriptional regulator [Bacteroidota bacterium]
MLGTTESKTEALKQPWIQAGYRLFAKLGPQGLKIEVIARQVQKSKSSFYHHFADLEVFTEHLLHLHVEQTALISEKEKRCQNIDPELIAVLVEHKQDLLFNRQLRINREVPAFKACFEKSNQYVAESFLPLWVSELGLTQKPQLAHLVLGLATENFYLQITEENLNHDWLAAYFHQIHHMVVAFQA